MNPLLTDKNQTIKDNDNGEINVLEENVIEPVTSTPINAAKSSSTSVYLKYISLILYILQSVIRTTVLRAAVTKSDQRFISSTFVFVGEIEKAILSIFLILLEELNPIKGFKAILRAILTEPFITLQISLTAVIYTIQNNLSVYAVRKLDIATLGVTGQLKILTTALFMRFLLKRRLNIIQWFALLLLFIGISIVDFQILMSKEKNKNLEPIGGLAAVIISCICSGFAGVYQEKIVKNTDISLWVCNIQLALMSILTSAFTMYILDGDEIKDHGILYNYTTLVWISTVLHSLGGLSVALVIKYSDNILKGFASSSSIILYCIIAIIFFQFKLTILFTIGTLFVIISIIIYSNPNLILFIPICKRIFNEKLVFL